MELSVKAVSSLDKIYKSKEDPGVTKLTKISGLKGENISFQLDYFLDEGKFVWGSCKIESEIEKYIRVRKVELVPVVKPKDVEADDDYIESEPCLLPDLLRDTDDGKFPVIPGYHKSLWIDVEIPKDAKAGTYKTSFTLSGAYKEDAVSATTEISIEIIDALIPELPVCHTEWFYADCIADYYGVEPMSDRFFELCENFVRTAVKRNINTILMPVFTPALDTEVGLERTTVQMVDVTVTAEGKYEFGFENLRRFIDICKKAGVTNYEVSHLFTQWGCECAPKVVGKKDGKLQKLFGWDNGSSSPEYVGFLESFLPRLKDELVKAGIYKNTFFHISDEPRAAHREAYKKANATVRRILPDAVFLDALSDVDFYKEGLIDIPACGANKLNPFFEEKVENLWTYYCCSQVKASPNRFIAMPSSRNRVLGSLIYKNKIKGFLHWGYNFYNCMLSLHHIDPYLTTDAEGGVSAGDPFLVYPGKDGRPEESIRLLVLSEAFDDIRALKLLESLKSFEETAALLGDELHFDRYPTNSEYYVKLRESVNEKIKALINRAK